MSIGLWGNKIKSLNLGNLGLFKYDIKIIDLSK